MNNIPLDNRATLLSTKGKTDEAIAMENEASNRMVSDTMGTINAAADAHKQNIQGQFKQAEAGFDQMQYNAKVQEAQQIANAAAEVSKTGASIVGSVFDKKE